VLRRLSVTCLVLQLVAGSARATGEDEVPALLSRLVRGSPGESSRALDRLRYLGVAVTAPSLRVLLASPSARERLAASSAYVVIHDPGATSLLEQVLTTDADWEVRRNAVNALAGLRARNAKRLIEHTLLHDPQERVRKSCISALSTLGGAGAALAASSATDTSLEVRLVALDALAHSLDPSVGPRLRPLLQDPSALVRFAAARALSWTGDPAGRRYLEKALASNDPEEVRHAATAISDVPKSWAVELLVHTLDGPDGEVACNSAAALARRQDERGTRYLLKVASSAGPQAQQARTWLDRIGVVETPPQLPGGAAP